MRKIIIEFPDDMPCDMALDYAKLHAYGGYQSFHTRKGVRIPHFCWVKSYKNSGIKTYSRPKNTVTSPESIVIINSDND